MTVTWGNKLGRALSRLFFLWLTWLIAGWVGFGFEWSWTIALAVLATFFAWDEYSDSRPTDRRHFKVTEVDIDCVSDSSTTRMQMVAFYRHRYLVGVLATAEQPNGFLSPLTLAVHHDEITLTDATGAVMLTAMNPEYRGGPKYTIGVQVLSEVSHG